MTHPLLVQFNRLSISLKSVLLIMMVLMLGWIDYSLGNELSFSIFYEIPVGLAVWTIHKRAGVFVAIFSALIWYVADKLSGKVYSHDLIGMWNTCIRLGYFILFAQLLFWLKKSLQDATRFANTDNLTGADNSRHFYAKAEQIISIASRQGQPVVLAYMDLDNFKQVNDIEGHLMGDNLLKTVVKTAQATLRESDVFARLGGDEFALLLPNTSLNEAESVLFRLRQMLLEAMQANDWAVTFSIGAVGVDKVAKLHQPSKKREESAVQPYLDALIKEADNLMYAVKHEQKNALRIQPVTLTV